MFDAAKNAGMLIGREVRFAEQTIQADYESGNVESLASTVKMYRDWATRGQYRARSTYAFLMEYAQAALEMATSPTAFRACDDCGDIFEVSGSQLGDTTVICPECGDSRDFKHGQGRYYDAFA